MDKENRIFFEKLNFTLSFLNLGNWIFFSFGQYKLDRRNVTQSKVYPSYVM